jgi:similar to spore coat protein
MISINGGDQLTTGKTIAPHEVMELHELLTFKNLCATKSATMAGLVKDEELKGMLQQDFTASQSHIKELQTLMQQGADWTASVSQSSNQASMQ